MRLFYFWKLSEFNYGISLSIKVKTIKYIIAINSSCRVFYYKYTVSFKYVM